MEKFLLEELQFLHRDALLDPTAPLRRFFSCRAVILHPSPSRVSLHALFDCLIQILKRDDPSNLHRHALKLLADLVIRDPDLFPLPSLISVLIPILISAKRSAAEALSALISIGRSGKEARTAVRSALGPDLILSLATSRPLAIRSQLLRLLAIVFCHGRESSSGDVQTLSVLRVFFGLTADLYPSSRSSALDGLRLLCENEVSWMSDPMMQRCYDVAIELLHDDEVFVKMSAVRLMSACAQMLLSTKKGTEKETFSDEQFLKLCSLARDMDARIRVEVFLSLEKIKLVSENALLQSLTKKVKKIEFSERGCGLPVSSAAGVFLQGLEDEFHEVRRAACSSMGGFASLSLKFAAEALDLLMDMLNDDYEVVQLQTLETLLQMANDGNMNVEERHMHMFLGTLANVSARIRLAARNVIRSTQLSNMGLFRMAVSGLLRNLEAYGEDEEDILAALFCMGRAHGEFAAKIVEKYSPEIESQGLGESKLERPRTVAVIVLGISPSFSNQALTLTMPARIFSYAIPLLGKISCSLKEFISQEALLSLLYKNGGLPLLEEPQMGGTDIELFEALTVSAVNQTLERVSEAWHAMKTHSSSAAVEVIRSCSKELEMVGQSLTEASDAFLVFSIEYVEVLQLFAQIWDQIQSKVPRIIRLGKLEILLEKLEVKLGRLRFLFLGLTEKEESHLLELSLFHCLLRLSAVKSSEAPQIMSKKRVLISRLEKLASEGKFELSTFVKESRNFSWSTPILDIPDLGDFDQVGPTRRLRLRKAELRASVVDRDLPLMFIPGLPVGIPVEITLHNISNSERLWLRMDSGKSAQYAFLSVDHFEGSDVDRRLSVDLSFYDTPKVPFILKAAVCLECTSGYLLNRKSQRGPRRETADLSQEVEIYLADVGNTGLW